MTKKPTIPPMPRPPRDLLQDTANAGVPPHEAVADMVSRSQSTLGRSGGNSTSHEHEEARLSHEDQSEFAAQALTDYGANAVAVAKANAPFMEGKGQTPIQPVSIGPVTIGSRDPIWSRAKLDEHAAPEPSKAR